MERTQCAICSSELNGLYINDNVPISLSINDQEYENNGFNNQDLQYCQKCSRGQLKNLTNPSILYTPIALIVTGNIRTFELCVQNFEDLCAKYMPDVYICVSSSQYDLHPYNQKTLNFHRNNILTESQIKQKLSFAPLFYSRIKNLIILNPDEEDIYIKTNFLAKFDKKKDWIGLDIFKQYNKIRIALDTIQNISERDNIKYDMIIKTRFDFCVDLQSLPNTVEPNTVYTSYDTNIVSDKIFIGTFDNIRKIQIGVFECFIDNPIGYSKDIHTFLSYVFNKHDINNNIVLRGNLNRDYHNTFDTNITLVTCFYDINRDKWNGYSRTVDAYFESTERVMSQKYPLFIFTTENFVDRCVNIRKKTDTDFCYTQIIILPFEKLANYDKLQLIDEIMKANIVNIPQNSKNCPEFCEPKYVIVIHNKIHFLKYAADKNPYGSNIFQWIDFGLHKNVWTDQIGTFSQILYKPNKIRITHFANINKKSTPNRTQFYNSHNETCASGLFGGNISAINNLYIALNNEFEQMLSDKLMNQEQYNFFYLMHTQPELFDCILAHGWNDVGNAYIRANTIHIALCMSGHLRSFDTCHNNIVENIVEPLSQNGFKLNLFISTWDTTGFRTDNFSDEKINMNMELSLLKNASTIEVEESNRNHFLNTYHSDRWKTVPHLSGPNTYPDSVSALYKISKSYKLASAYGSYDIIFRIRPDVLYNHPFNPELIKECIYNNAVYMPRWHGKYFAVTMGIMDQFMFGTNEAMKPLMETYDNIQSLYTTDCPHNAEGFIHKQLKLDNINIVRFDVDYGILYKNNNYISFSTLL